MFEILSMNILEKYLGLMKKFSEKFYERYNMYNYFGWIFRERIQDNWDEFWKISEEILNKYLYKYERNSDKIRKRSWGLQKSWINLGETLDKL